MKRIAPTSLRVFYDAECGLCRACRDWISGQRKFVPIDFTPYQSGTARRFCPGLDRLHPDRQIVVLGDNGAIYQGGAAWVMCFWALRDYRELSGRLASPALLPLAKKTCALVSQNRLRLSGLMGLRPRVKAAADPACSDGACRVPELEPEPAAVP